MIKFLVVLACLSLLYSSCSKSDCPTNCDNAIIFKMDTGSLKFADIDTLKIKKYTASGSALLDSVTLILNENIEYVGVRYLGFKRLTCNLNVNYSFNLDASTNNFYYKVYWGNGTTLLLSNFDLIVDKGKKSECAVSKKVAVNGVDTDGSNIVLLR